MKSVELFVGFPLTAMHLFKLGQLPEAERALFLGSEEGQLATFYFKNQPYLGKRIGKETTLDALTLLEKHIFSILKKWLPETPPEETKLMVIPCE